MQLPIGSIFQERYEILECLGSGGMGTVYKALQLDANRKIALKILHELNVIDEDDIKRFRREAKILARLQHKNIVTFYHFGFTDEAIPYAAMEYISGISLARVLREKGSMSSQVCTHIMVQVCEALEFAHSEGVIHRDLKPDNILLVDLPAPYTVKIIDFGLAKVNDKSGLATNKLTRTGLLIGSPQYMSPEQARGLDADARSDIYSCGCILFEMVSGQKPYDADNSIGLLYKICNSNPPEFSEIGAAKSDNSQLELICRRALQKRPEERFPDFAEMKDALEGRKMLSASEKKLPGSPPKHKPKSISSWARRVALGLLACTAVATLVWSKFHHPANSEMSRYGHAKKSDKAKVGSSRARKILEAEEYRYKAKIDQAAGKNAEVIDDISKLVELCSAQPEDFNRRAIALSELGAYKECEADCDSALRLDPNCLEAFCRKGLAFLSEGRYKDSELCFEEAQKKDPKYGWAVSGTATALLLERNYEEAISGFSRALAIRDQQWDLFNRGIAYRMVGKEKSAKIELMKALKLAAKYPDHYCAACCLRSMKQTKQAIAEIDKLMEQSPNNLYGYINRAECFYDNCDYEGALEDSNKALAIAPNHPRALMNRGAALIELNQAKKGLEDLNKSIKLAPDLDFGEGYYYRALAYKRLGMLDLSGKDYAKAMKMDFDKQALRFNHLPRLSGLEN